MTTPTEEEWQDIKGTWEEFHGEGDTSVDGDDSTEDSGVDESVVPDEPIVEEQEEDVGRGDVPDGSTGGGDAEVVVEVQEEEAAQNQRRTRSAIESIQEAQEIAGQAERAAAMRQIDKPLQMDDGIFIHFSDRDHDALLEILADQIDTTVEQFYDHSKESDRDGWDRYFYWTLSRDEVDDPWSPDNIDLPEFIDSVEAGTEDGVLIESNVYELK